MEKLLICIFFTVLAGFAFFGAYQAFKCKRGFWFSFSGLKSEINPKWCAFIQGFFALLFGLFIVYLGVSVLLQ